MYSTIGGRRGPAAAAWFLTPPRRTSWRLEDWRWRMRGCPVFIKAGCDRMVKLRAGNSGPYDNPALMRLVLLVSRGSSIYPHGPGAANANNQKYCKIVPHVQGFKYFFWKYFYFKMLQWPYLIPPRESAAAASDPPVPSWSPHSVFCLHTPS